MNQQRDKCYTITTHVRITDANGKLTSFQEIN